MPARLAAAPAPQLTARQLQNQIAKRQLVQNQIVENVIAKGQRDQMKQTLRVCAAAGAPEEIVMQRMRSGSMVLLRRGRVLDCVGLSGV